MAIKLYNSPGSPNGRAILALALELGIEFDIQNVDLMQGEQKKPEFLALNPNGKIPMIEVGGWRLWESGAILCYLADKHPKNDLYPTDAKLRAEVIKWICWDQAHLAGEAIFPLAAEGFRPKMGLGEIRKDIVDKATEAFERFLSVLNNSLEGHDYLVNDKFTIADFSVVSTLSAVAFTGLDLTKYKRVEAYVERIGTRDSWKKTAPPPMPEG